MPLPADQALPAEKRGGDQLDRRLARQAVQAGRLTLWQAQQLLSGRSSVDQSALWPGCSTPEVDM